MATLEREEGDYTYWSDGAQRYAKGNTLGKAPGSLAKRHPKAATSFDKLSPAKLKSLVSNGHETRRIKREQRRLMSMGGLQEALLTHPDSQEVKDGLRMLWEARIEQANDSEGGGPAVNAHKLIEEAWSGTSQASRPAQQLNIGTMNLLTMNTAGLEYLKDLDLEIIDAEVREVEDDDE